MNYEMRRQKVYEKMEEHSVLILFSGIEEPCQRGRVCAL